MPDCTPKGETPSDLQDLKKGSRQAKEGYATIYHYCGTGATIPGSACAALAISCFCRCCWMCAIM